MQDDIFKSTDKLATKDLSWLKGVSYNLISTEKDLQYLADRLLAADIISYDTETTGLSFLEDHVVGASFSVREGEAFYVPLAHSTGANVDKDLYIKTIGPFLEQKKVIGWNIKFDWHMTWYSHKVELNIFADSMVVVALMDMNRKRMGLKAVATDELGFQTVELTDFLPSKTAFHTLDASSKIGCQYACQDADLNLRLYNKFHKQSRDLQPFIYDMEMSCIKPLGRQERNGVALDVDALKRYQVTLGPKIDRLAKDIFEAIGKPLPDDPSKVLGSPKKLGEILFTDLRLPQGKQGKKYPSTDKAVLADLAQLNPVVGMILEYKKLTHLKNSFVDALLHKVSKDGRIRTNYMQVLVPTGRIASSTMDREKGEGTNLQQIAKGEVEADEDLPEEEAVNIRRVFIPSPGFKWLKVDASQIEYRIFASASGEKALIDGFNRGVDYHSQTAAFMYGVALAEITKEQRNKGKTLNFGLVFGMSVYSLAKRLGVAVEVAQALYDGYFNRLPGMKRFIQGQHELAFKQGFVKTYYGRVRYIPEIRSHDRGERGFGERTSVNTFCQGCQKFETRILTDRGYLRIGDLYGLQLVQGAGRPLSGFHVWNGHKFCEFEVLNRGKASLVDYEFSDGSILHVDNRHVVKLIKDYGAEWSVPDGVLEGDRVAQSIAHSVEFSGVLPALLENYGCVAPNARKVDIKYLMSNMKEFWWWNGEMEGDGWVSKRGAYVTCGREEYKRVFARAGRFFKKLGFLPSLTKSKTSKGDSWRIGVEGKNLAKTLEAFGWQYGCTARTKRFPEYVFSETLEHRAAFVRGYFDSDGTKGGETFSWHISQRPLLEDLQLLLRSCGVRSKIYDGSDDAFVLTVTDSDAFADLIGVKRKKFLFKKYGTPQSFYRETPGYLLSRFVKLFAEKFPLGGKKVFVDGLEVFGERLVRAKGLLRKCKGTNEYHRNLRLFRREVKGEVSFFSYLDECSSREERYRLGALVSKITTGKPVSIDTFLFVCRFVGIPLWEDVYDFVRLRRKVRVGREEETYTLSVYDDSHAYDSNGIISKNTAADIQKMAIIGVDRLIAERPELGIRANLNVHDEIDFEIPEDGDVVKICKEIRKVITPVIPGYCRFDFEFEVGDNWGDLKKVELPPEEGFTRPVVQQVSPAATTGSASSLAPIRQSHGVVLPAPASKQFPCVEVRVEKVTDLQAKAMKLLFENSPGPYRVYLLTGADKILFETSYSVDPNKRLSDYLRKIFKESPLEIQIYSGDSLREAQKVSVDGIIFS